MVIWSIRFVFKLIFIISSRYAVVTYKVKQALIFDSLITELVSYKLLRS